MNLWYKIGASSADLLKWRRIHAPKRGISIFNF